MNGIFSSLFAPQVPFNAVALRVIHTDVAPTNIMYAVNASWVGLCRLPEEIRGQSDGPVLLTQTPLCDCLGFGEPASPPRACADGAACSFGNRWQSGVRLKNSWCCL